MGEGTERQEEEEEGEEEGEEKKRPHTYPVLLDDITMPFRKHKDRGKAKRDFLHLPTCHFCICKVPAVGVFFLPSLVCGSHVGINIY